MTRFQSLVQTLEQRRMMSATADVPARYDDGFALDPTMPQAIQVGGRWSSTATNGTAVGSTGSGITLTYSIVPDGTTLPSGNSEPPAPSELRKDLNVLYGSESSWLPIFQQIFNSWSAISGVTYVYEPNDDGVAYSSSTSGKGALGVRGDVRIGAHNVDGASGILAYNYFPNYGDMVIDAADLITGGYMTNLTNNSLRLRNVLAHEHGHGLGLNHVDPVEQTKLMEPYVSTRFDGPQFDDMLAVQRNYGDFYEKLSGNNSAANAANRGTLADGMDSLTNLSLATTVDVDYYKFTLSAAKDATITVAPFGPTYLQGQQGGATSSFNAQAQMDVQFQLLASNGTTVLGTANAAGVGSSETLAFAGLAAGTYYVKVLPAPLAADSPQMYSLSTSIATPVATTTSLGLDASKNLTINDTTGKTDQLTLGLDSANSRFVLTDPNNMLGTSIAGATGSGTHTLYIPYSSVTGGKIILSLGSGNDSLTVTGTTVPVSVDAGTGTDAITISETAAAGAVTLLPSAGSDNLNVNTDNTGSASVLLGAAAQKLGAVTIGAGGSVAMSAGNTYFQTQTLSINAAGKLDLSDNDIIVNNGNFATIRSLVFAGYSAAADATKKGIVSSAGQAAGNTIHALFDNTFAGATDWPLGSGNTVAANAVIGKYTYFGDMNLDGAVTPDDYGVLDASLNSSQSAGLAWLKGDANMDGAITPDDYAILDANLGNTRIA